MHLPGKKQALAGIDLSALAARRAAKSASRKRKCAAYAVFAADTGIVDFRPARTSLHMTGVIGMG
ncbi:hypothetical protein ACFONN_11200 [Dyella humi]|uniref:Uncharacterized protein n=1 Tax=Dyella humi TaxID=1770547 RepID=A0ABW8IK67_9GAMM